MTSPLDDARGELLALADTLDQWVEAIRTPGNFNLTLVDIAVLNGECISDDIEKAAAALRAAPVPQCDAGSARAAAIEECAKVVEAQTQEFLSPGYASNQPFGSICERFACEEVAKAIRALSIPSALRQCPICARRVASPCENLAIATSCPLSSTHQPGDA